ncbi:MAG: molybdopterin converting factor subunit 1 [Phycisphaerae bacterium]
MKVRVRLFAFMAQAAGTRDLELDMPAAATLRDVEGLLRERYAAIRWPGEVMWAINQEYAESANAQLKDGDEVAIIPPVSGG